MRYNEKQLQLVTFEQAKKLKEAGFDYETHYGYWAIGNEDNSYPHLQSRNTQYDDSIDAPTVALALQFIFEKYSILGYVKLCCHSTGNRGYIYYFDVICDKNKSRESADVYSAPNKAQSALLDELLKII